jgi:hypothetical protein
MLREAAEKLAPEALGILFGWIDADGTRRNRKGIPYTGEELATCRLFVSFGKSEAELKALDEGMIASGQVECRDERVAPLEGHEGALGTKLPPAPGGLLN